MTDKQQHEFNEKIKLISKLAADRLSDKVYSLLSDRFERIINNSIEIINGRYIPDNSEEE